ncbi:MAG TPA: VWA domain-containing protein [Myxococcales bacterium]|nr:VWA domain-containing protein [Myxococcales bacterium]
MKFDKVKTADCLRKATVVVPDITEPKYVPPTEEIDYCKDELFAFMAGQCLTEEYAATLCNEMPGISGIRIFPQPRTGATAVEVEGGHKIKFRIKVNFVYGGETREVDVSEFEAHPDSNGNDFYSFDYDLYSEDTVLEREGPGSQDNYPTVFKAGVVTADTNTTVYARLELFCHSGDAVTPVAGFKAEVPVTVKTECQRIGTDFALVVDRSGSMLRDDKTDRSRLVGAKEACLACIAGAKWPTLDAEGSIITNQEYDRLAVISYAGTKGVSNTTRHTEKFVWTQSEAEKQIKEIQVAEACGGQGKNLETCSTGMGGGLLEAYNMMLEDPRKGKRRLIILITDGYENVCATGEFPETVAATIKTDSASSETVKPLIVAIGFRTLGAKTVRKCDNTSITVSAYLTSIASCDLYYAAQDTDELDQILQTIHEVICKLNNADELCDDAAYSITGPTETNPNPCLNAQYNYKGFDNWVVSRGYVDLMGGDIWGSLFTGSGKFVGLIGQRGSLIEKEAYLWGNHKGNCQKYWVPWDRQFGGIETIENFVFESGQEYQLTINLAGNGAVTFADLGKELCSTVRVSVGGVQAGELYNDYYQDWPDAAGTPRWGYNKGIPVLCTRELVNPIYNKTITVDPMSDITPHVITISGRGNSGAIRIEQFPLGWNKNTFTQDVDPEVFAGRGCVDVINPVSVREYGGFRTDMGTLRPDERYEQYRYQTSGGDEFVAPPAFGVCVIDVKLEKITGITSFEDATCDIDKATPTTIDIDSTVVPGKEIVVGQIVSYGTTPGLVIQGGTRVTAVLNPTSFTVDKAVVVTQDNVTLKFTTVTKEEVFSDTFSQENVC